MAESYVDSLLDFDLDFLHQNITGPAVPNKLEKIRKQILLAKKKTIAVDSLIKKFYEKREEKIVLEKNILESKEECKQACINYKNAMQRLSYLEEKNEKFEKCNRDLQEAFNSSENRCHGLQSHANQLQLLVKERETKMEALEIEQKLEKASKQDIEKKVTLLQKEVSLLENKIVTLGKDKDVLYEHIHILRDVVLGKKKNNNEVKLLLNKYKSSTSEELPISDSEDIKCDLDEVSSLSPGLNEIDNSDDTEIVRVIVLSDSAQEVNIIDGSSESKNSLDFVNMRVCDIDSESSSGVVTSEDTGRGSSLTFSDSDKCFNSPEHYSNDSVLNSEIILKSNRNLVSCENGQEHSQIITKITNNYKSPIESYDKTRSFEGTNISLENSPEIRQKNADICSMELEQNCPISSVNSVERIEINPVKSLTKSQCCNVVKTDNLTQIYVHERQIKQSFTQSKSNTLCLDNDDYEVSNILNTMSLHHKLITPLPPSPEPVSVTNIFENSNNLENPDNSQVAMLFNCFSKILQDINELKSSVPTATTLKQMVNEICDERDKNKHKALHSGTNVINDGTKENTAIHYSPLPENVNSLVLDDDVIPVGDDLSFSNNDADIHDRDNNLIENISEKESRVVDRLLFDEPCVSNDGRLSAFSSEIEEVDLIVIPPENCDTNLLLDNESNNKTNQRQHRRTKMSKLQKLRKRLQPKNKIKSNEPIKKSKKIKTLNPQTTHTDSAKTSNNKDVYEKALAVVAEFRSKQKLLLDKKIKLRNKSKQVKKVNDKEVENNHGGMHSDHPMTHFPEFVPTQHYKHLPQESVSKELIKNKSECSSNKNTCNNGLVNVPLESKKELKCKTTDRNKNKIDTEIERDLELDLRKPNETSPRLANKRDDDSVLNKDDIPLKPTTPRKCLKRSSAVSFETPSKRILRSSSLRISESDKNSHNENNSHKHKVQVLNEVDTNQTHKTTRNYKKKELELHKVEDLNEPRNSILCKMVEKYGISVIRHKQTKKLSEKNLSTFCSKLEESVKYISELQNSDVNKEMDKLVDEILRWGEKHFVQVLLKYLKDPERKTELFNKINNPPGPPMTKVEQILLYVITQLQVRWPTIVTSILRNIEYTIFRLNHTPEFDVIECMSHFYAVLCRYTRSKRRLRLFLLDAMYCIAFKSIPLIKQCIDVWMHVLPLAHMRMAKIPLVACVVYLLHFYRCEDPFNRVQTMRYILQHKFSYEMGEWGETQILELFNSAILELRDNTLEKKMLRIALILLAKRNGPKWSLKHIVKNMLLSSLEKNIPERNKQFCITLIGPILKPFPQDMKVHCEIIMNQLTDMLKQNNSHEMEESVIKSLLFMNKLNTVSVSQALFTWKPKKPISQELEELMRDFIRERPIKIWMRTISNLNYCNN